MQKTFCDRCGKEMELYLYVRVQVPDPNNPIWIDEFKHLCLDCRSEFVKLLDGFIPNFFGIKKPFWKG